MRTRYLIALFGILAPGVSLACSCWGTESIGAALNEADAVVVARVVGAIPADYAKEPVVPEGIVLEILKSLRGDLSGKIYVPKSASCYQSFDAREFKTGEAYVLPLHVSAPAPHDTDGDHQSVVVGAVPTAATYPAGRWFTLPGCSHSALALVDGELYTNELTRSGGRKRKNYMSLATMESLLPLGVLDPFRALMYVAISGIVALAIYLPRMIRRLRSGLPVPYFVSWPVVAIPSGIAFLFLAIFLSEALQESALRAAFMNFAYDHTTRTFVSTGIAAAIVASVAYSILRQHAVALGLTICFVSTAVFAMAVWYSDGPIHEAVETYRVPFISQLIFAPVGAVLMSWLLRPDNRVMRWAFVTGVGVLLAVVALMFNTNLFIPGV